MTSAFHASDTSSSAVDEWNQDIVIRNSVRALLGIMIGGPQYGTNSTSTSSQSTSNTVIKEGWLSDLELDELLEVTADYRRRGPRRRKLDSKESYAERISSILQLALWRCAEVNVDYDKFNVLPILVSAIVGGAEIYPLLLHWAVRHLAVSPGLQRALREDCRSNSPGADPQLNYGALIGPPRKLTEDVAVAANQAADGTPEQLREVLLRKEAILFVLHPGLFIRWTQRIQESQSHLSTATPNSDASISVRAAADMRQSSAAAAAAAAEEVLQCKSSSWPMFGMGARSCIAPEMSFCFLSSMHCALLSRYEVRVDPQCAEKYTVDDLFRYSEDGSLLVTAIGGER